MRLQLLTFLCCISISAIAGIDKSFYAKAPMEILESRLSFEENKVHDVEIILFKNKEKKISDLEILWNYIDPKTGELSYEAKLLKVEKIFSLGEVRILKAVMDFGKNANPENERFIVTLHHHVIEGESESERVWTAKVRHGFGYCDSHDSKMTLRGRPLYAKYAMPTTTTTQQYSSPTLPNSGEEFF